MLIRFIKAPDQTRLDINVDAKKHSLRCIVLNENLFDIYESDN